MLANLLDPPNDVFDNREAVITANGQPLSGGYIVRAREDDVVTTIAGKSTKVMLAGQLVDIIAQQIRSYETVDGEPLAFQVTTSGRTPPSFCDGVLNDGKLSIATRNAATGQESLNVYEQVPGAVLSWGEHLAIAKADLKVGASLTLRLYYPEGIIANQPLEVGGYAQWSGVVDRMGAVDVAGGPAEAFCIEWELADPTKRQQAIGRRDWVRPDGTLLMRVLHTADCRLLTKWTPVVQEET